MNEGRRERKDRKQRRKRERQKRREETWEMEKERVSKALEEKERGNLLRVES